MIIFMTIMATLGWVAAFFIFTLFRVLSKVYVSEKTQNEILRTELNRLQPTDWNQWLPPYE